jgi:transposase
MIPKETEAEILRLRHAENWPVGTIANHLHLHHSVVRRVIHQDAMPDSAPTMRPSIADPYLPFMREMLEKHPKLRASRLFHMARERGYPGKQAQFRAIVARMRPQPKAEAFLRLCTLPGEQAQVDWGHFGKVQIGKAERRLYGFVMTLSWSRAIFLRFYLADNTANFLRGHADAFTWFGGVPRTILYDNLKSAVIERVKDAIRFNDNLLAFAGHHRFAPQPVNVARGNEKGRVERSIRYIRDNFFAARSWSDIDDLNAQAIAWCQGPAMDRAWPEDRSLTVRASFAQDQERLLPLPEHTFPVDERLDVRIGKTPYARFDLNDYSVPHDCVRRTLTIAATTDTVRIIDGNTIVATHPRTFDKGAQIENPDHIQALVDHKRQAKQHRGMDRLHHAAPNSLALFEAVALRGGGLGGLTSGLLKLLDQYGADTLDRSIAEAIQAGTPHLAAVRQILDRRRREAGLPPPLAVHLPDDPRVRNLVVHAHPLHRYDTLSNQEGPAS